MILQKHTSIGGLSIAVYENSIESEQVILFLHGNSLGAFTFFKQLKDPLLQKYRCITFDFPGHGDSASSANPTNDYSMPGMIKIIEEVIKSLNLSTLILAGHSFGGHLLLEAMAGELQEKIKGLIIFGSPPMTTPPTFNEMFFPLPEAALIFKETLDDSEAASLASVFIKKTDPQIHEIKQSIKNTDPLFRKYLGESIMTGNTMNEMAILSNIKVPVAIFHGRDDQIVNPVYFEKLNFDNLWRNKILMIANAGHCVQMENAKVFNHSLSEFCEFIFSDRPLLSL